MYECESWTIKKAESNNWYFRTVVLEKTLESPLDCMEIKPVNSKGNQPWIFTGMTLVEAEAPILWPPDVKPDSLEKTLMLGKIEGKRRRGRQSMKQLDGIINWMDVSLNKLREIVKDEEAWRAAVHRVTKNRTQLSEWTARTMPWSILKAGAPGWQRSSCLRLWFQLGKQEPD